LGINRETVARYLRLAQPDPKPAIAPIGSQQADDATKPAIAPMGAVAPVPGISALFPGFSPVTRPESAASGRRPLEW
jgi:hypothetical protein